MKYLRRINETVSEQDILDCFTDLADAGFNIYCADFYNEKVRYFENYIIIEKTMEDKDNFTINDVEETLLFAIPYLKEHIKFGHIIIIYDKGYLECIPGLIGIRNKRTFYGLNGLLTWVEKNGFKSKLKLHRILIKYII